MTRRSVLRARRERRPEVGGTIKKLDGVESIELLPDKGTADIRLRADNKITLREVRGIVKSTGYT